VDDALANWLALREPHDWAARDASLVEEVVRALPRTPTTRVLDLGTGTGSNLRYLMTRLPPRQEWVLVDKSPDVLHRVLDRTAGWASPRGLRLELSDTGFTVHGQDFACQVRLERQDLDLPLDPSLFVDRQLVTASALLDLVSDAWLRALVSRCRDAGAAALFALTYNGDIVFEPRDRGDDRARELLNAHQLRDKGLGGPAVGPGAHERARYWFREGGFHVCEATTNWDVDESAARFQEELIAGVAGAAIEQQPDSAEDMAAWRARRFQHLRARPSRVIVGHHDLAAWLPRR
jgi:SAM-dependent methyltransferase